MVITRERTYMLQNAMKYALKNLQVRIKSYINMLKYMHLKMLIYAFIFKKIHKIYVYNIYML